MANRILIATRKGIFVVEHDSDTWQIKAHHFFGDNCSIIAHDQRDGAIYAALDHGHFGCKLHRSRDDGKTWQEIATPQYPEMPESEKERANPNLGKVLPWSLKLIWAIVPGGDDQPGRLWCGTLPGGLFVSNDSGDSWELVRSLWDRPERIEWFGGGYEEPGIHSICIDPRNSQHVTIGISCGGVWKTDDDGKTWHQSAQGMRADYMPPDREFDENIQDPHMMVRCKSEPDKLWVQHHNGIFRSVDNCATWQEVDAPKPSGFGFGCVVHPNDGNTAWFVPAHSDEKRVPIDGKFVVNRTTDGGKTFETLTKGLPNHFANDLVFRHAMDIDESGETLVIGSTTGGLWVSEDGGDSWQTISAHLPPIYCVELIGD